MSILDQFKLTDKVIVVTGGTGILGKSFVTALGAAGAKVAILGRHSGHRAAERIEQVENAGGEAAFFQADVLNEEVLRKVKNEILQRWGRIDGLVNAAGGNIPGATIGPDQDLFAHNLKDTMDAVNLNLFGTIIPTFVFGEEMAKSRSGAIVNISSLSGNKPLTRVMGYTVAKHGINGFTKWMAAELPLRYGDGLRCNAIAPGVFLTTQNKDLLTKPDGSFTDRAQKFVNNTPFARLGDPDELQGALIYLLSDASRFVNGEILYVDGGFNSWSGV